MSEHNAPPLEPNIVWCDEHSGEQIRLDWPEQSFVVSVREVKSDE